MPELETRFAEIPDWLNYKQPAVPSFLDTREDVRRQRQSERDDWRLMQDQQRLQMDEDLHKYRMEEAKIKNETAKAALDYTMQTRAAQGQLGVAMAEISKLDGGYTNPQAFSIGMDILGKNPALANSEAGKLFLNNLATANRINQELQKGKELRSHEANLGLGVSKSAIERNLALAQKYRESGDEDTAKKIESLVFGKQESEDRETTYKSLSARINKEIDAINRSKDSTQEKDIKKDPLFRKLWNLEQAFKSGGDMFDAIGSFAEAPSQTQAADEVEQVLNSWDKQIDLWEATQDGKLDLKPDGTVVDAGYFGGLTPAEARKEVAKKRAAYRSSKGGQSAPQTDTRTPPQDPRMGELPTMRYNQEFKLVK